MQNFRNLGNIGGGCEIFLTKPQKGTSLSDFTRFEPTIVQIRSRVFATGVCMKKRNTTKSHKGFHVFAGNSPPNQIQPKLAYK